MKWMLLVATMNHSVDLNFLKFKTLQRKLQYSLLYLDLNNICLNSYLPKINHWTNFFFLKTPLPNSHNSQKWSFEEGVLSEQDMKLTLETEQVLEIRTLLE